MTVERRLSDERNVWLATTRPDGRPHLTPIWFVYLRDRFWIGTGRDNVKTRNVRSDPRVSISLEDGNDPVVAEGTVVVHEQERPPDVVDAFRAKYQWDITLPDDPDVGAVVLWEVAVRKWLFVGPDDG
ncbi:MAG: pyridoxamine 5'-phosphate oxidase family protein [Actinomycetota bacterium]